MNTTVLIRRTLSVAALLLPLLVVWGCSKRADVTGRWEGTVDLSSIAQTQGKPGNTTLRIVLTIRQEGDQLKAFLVTPDESPAEVAADTVEFKNGSLTVKVSKRLSLYEAKINSDGTELHGSFKQEPYNLPLALKKSPGA